ncbi:MAG TPA: alcohol dehydrogenase catalytic domain-containing protein [Bryobacteraceae bacterium]|nr:alcohol dehydrogenase catalytic domain-containing protein [Bryobacteraceae bacterium]
MLAVHLEGGAVMVRQVAKPRRPAGFASIRLIYAGICNTDLELRRGYYGFRGTPGHEFVGEVIDADTRELIGKHVVGEINLSCGRCEWCARSLGRHCPTRTVLGIVKHPGAFREILTLPERNLHVIPESIPLEHAVFVEPLAAACEILDQVQMVRGERVAVLGDGKLGLLIALMLHTVGAEVHHFGRHKEKLQISRNAGIRTPRKPAAYDYVVDATGSPDGLRQAVAITRSRGKLILKSTMHGLVPVDTAPIIVNELTLVGSRCGRFEPALRLLQLGKVNVAPLISEIMPLKEAAAAFDRAGQSGVLKVLLAPE